MIPEGGGEREGGDEGRRLIDLLASPRVKSKLKLNQYAMKHLSNSKWFFFANYLWFFCNSKQHPTRALYFSDLGQSPPSCSFTASATASSPDSTSRPCSRGSGSPPVSSPRRPSSPATPSSTRTLAASSWTTRPCSSTSP